MPETGKVTSGFADVSTNGRGGVAQLPVQKVPVVNYFQNLYPPQHVRNVLDRPLCRSEVQLLRAVRWYNWLQQTERLLRQPVLVDVAAASA